MILNKKSFFCFSVAKTTAFLLVALALSGCVQDLKEFGSGEYSKSSRKAESSGQGVENVKPLLMDHPDNEATPKDYKTSGVSEELLLSKGNMNLIQQGEDKIDPTQAHLMARSKVNPKDKSKKAELSPHFDPNAQSGEDGTVRVLKVQGDMADADFSGGGAVQQSKNIISPTSKIIDDLNSNNQDIMAKSYVIYPPPLPPRKLGGGNALPVVENVILKTAQDKKALERIEIEKSGTNKAFSAPVPTTKPINTNQSEIYKGINKNSVARAQTIRAGENGNQTRLVIEFDTTPTYKVAIDKIRKVLRIKFIDIKWDIAESGSLNSPSLGSYVVHKNQDHSVIFEIRLKKESTIKSSTILPTQANNAQRFIVDLIH